jgi:hypothetical protein
LHPCLSPILDAKEGVTPALSLTAALTEEYMQFTKSCKNASKNETYLQEIYQSSNQENEEVFAISLSYVMQSL